MKVEVLGAPLDEIYVFRLSQGRGDTTQIEFVAGRIMWYVLP
jgi:hypothetical protein